MSEEGGAVEEEGGAVTEEEGAVTEALVGEASNMEEELLGGDIEGRAGSVDSEEKSLGDEGGEGGRK